MNLSVCVSISVLTIQTMHLNQSTFQDQRMLQYNDVTWLL